MLLVFILSGPLAVYKYFEQCTRHADSEFVPMIDGNITGRIAERFPVMAVAAQYEMAGWVESDFIAIKRVGSWAWIGGFDDESRIAAAFAGKHYFHTRFAIGECRCI